MGSPDDFRSVAQTGRFQESPTRGNGDPDWQGLYLYENGSDSLGYVRREEAPSAITYGGLFSVSPPSGSQVITVYDPGNPHGQVDPNDVLRSIRNHFDPDGTRIGTEPGAVMGYLAQNNYILRMNDGEGANEIVVPWGDQVRNTSASVYPGGDFTTFGRRNQAEQAIEDLSRQLQEGQAQAPVPSSGGQEVVDQLSAPPTVDRERAGPSTGGQGVETQVPQPSWYADNGVHDEGGGGSWGDACTSQTLCAEQPSGSALAARPADVSRSPMKREAGFAPGDLDAQQDEQPESVQRDWSPEGALVEAAGDPAEAPPAEAVSAETEPVPVETVPAEEVAEAEQPVPALQEESVEAPVQEWSEPVQEEAPVEWSGQDPSDGSGDYSVDDAAADSAYDGVS
ncbi:hypothetical protein OG389_00900 [Streptomyces sp. NBC_00435]|uniref:hypothetical protein n=1 Tax=Streptomyces sp. NBC_00435 TaxID=2903649 RepID=UPI002E1B96DF